MKIYTYFLIVLCYFISIEYTQLYCQNSAQIQVALKGKFDLDIDTIFSIKRANINYDKVNDYLVLTSNKERSLGYLLVLLSNKENESWSVVDLHTIYSWSFHDIHFNNTLYNRKSNFLLEYQEQHHDKEPSYSTFHLFYKFKKGKIILYKMKEDLFTTSRDTEIVKRRSVIYNTNKSDFYTLGFISIK